MMYEPALVARSLAGDHSWVPAFLKSVSPPKKKPRGKKPKGTAKKPKGTA
jgi:hypothetical protein